MFEEFLAMQAANQPQRRRRGRPKGSGINDEAYLCAIAEGLLAAPHVPPRTLIRAIVAKAFLVPSVAQSAQQESVVHRLAEKWRQEGACYLEAAKERRRTRQIEAMAQGAAALQRGVAEFAGRIAPVVHAAASRFEAALRSSEGQRALALMAKFQEAVQNDPFRAQVEAAKRDPRLIQWMLGTVTGGRLG